MPPPPTPVNPNVKVTMTQDPAGNWSGSVDQQTVNPVGTNATITFTFAAGSSGWTFSSFSIKSSGNQPPSGMFTNTNGTGHASLVIQDQNGDGKLYSYNLVVAKGTTSVTIDPDIQND